MKRLFFFTLVALCLSSCKSLPERFESFISEVETEYETYTELDWDIITQKYAAFEAEYAEQYDKLGAEEKAQMKKGFGRFDAIITKSAIKNTADGISRFFENAGDYVDGLIEGLMPSNDSTKVSE